MLDNLTNRLARVMKTVKGEARLTESNINDALREVRMALLEADVALPVIKDFIAAVRGGTTVVEGLAVDPDLRWSLVQALAARGRLDVAEIDAELERDRSTAGREKAATARALIPTPEAKEQAWQQAMHDDLGIVPTALELDDGRAARARQRDAERLRRLGQLQGVGDQVLEQEADGGGLSLDERRLARIDGNGSAPGASGAKVAWAVTGLPSKV